jgi:hypothetical protein
VRRALRIKGLTTGIVVAALALGLLLLPGAAVAGGDGPTATRSGALINYVTTGKLRIAKRIDVVVVCSADCQVDATTTVVAPGPNLIGNVSGVLAANIPGGPFIKPNGPLLKGMKASPGKYKIRSKITATDLATGAVETIARTFRLKR